MKTIFIVTRPRIIEENGKQINEFEKFCNVPLFVENKKEFYTYAELGNLKERKIIVFDGVKIQEKSEVKKEVQDVIKNLDKASFALVHAYDENLNFLNNIDEAILQRKYSSSPGSDIRIFFTSKNVGGLGSKIIGIINFSLKGNKECISVSNNSDEESLNRLFDYFEKDFKNEGDIASKIEFLYNCLTKDCLEKAETILNKSWDIEETFNELKSFKLADDDYFDKLRVIRDKLLK